MKRIILSTVLFSASMLSHATDWTPVFKPWTNMNAPQHPVALNFLKNIFNLDNATIRPSTKSGTYNSIPLPYRQDMLPAQIKRKESNVYEVKIPLKNATLFGLPLKRIDATMYDQGIGYAYYAVVFKPLTNQQLNKLNTIKKNLISERIDEEYDCEPIKGVIEKNKAGEMEFYVQGGC